MQSIHLSPVSAQHINELQSIARETFYETFAGDNTEADMQQYLDEKFNLSALQSELANPDSLFFIAWENETAIGYMKLNTGAAQTELQETTSLEIERIYVRNAYHGKKVGQLLYDKAFEVAREKNKTSLWLGVWEENHKAIRFYEKNGFVPFDKHVFRLGDDEQTDVMMRKSITV